MPDKPTPWPHPELPLDSDLEVAETPTGLPRPVHLRWQYLGLVFVGGSVGTAARYLLSGAIPSWQGLPLGTFVINVTGAFALGVLLESLIRRGADEGMRRTLRLLVGTGLIGGFTTYSSFSVEVDALLAGDQLWGSLAYSAATLALGGLASGVGILLAAICHGWRPRAKTRAHSRREAGQ